MPKGGYAAHFVFRRLCDAGSAGDVGSVGTKGGAVRPRDDGNQGDAGTTENEASGSHGGPQRVALADSGSARILPDASDPLFGRDDDIAILDGLLAEHRVVTVIGAGGIGKTRLVQAEAHALVDRRATRVAWVDLSRIADPALLPATLAQALALPIAQRGDPMRGLLAALRPLMALVVLDNAEHLVEATAQFVRAAIDTAPGLRVLVTSQAPLDIKGERVLRLEGLEVPPGDASPANAARLGAVALFIDRARAVDRRFELTDDNVAVVVRLCKRLDGLPLAIRLAAARMPLLGLIGLEARMNERLPLLAGTIRDVPIRQRTLLAALQWSYGLLSSDDQELFRRLGVFVGGFTLDLAVGACCSGADNAWAVVNGLGRLVDRSLVSVERSDPPRYRLLEAPRQYALQLLAEHEGELHAARQRHAQAVTDALFDAREVQWSMSDAEWLPRWGAELDNVRAALDWSETHDPLSFVSLIGSTPVLFRGLDLASELRRRSQAPAVESAQGVAPWLWARYWLARTVAQAGISADAFQYCVRRAEQSARGAADPRLLYYALSERLASGVVGAAEAEPLLAEIARLECTDWSPRLRAQRCMAEFGAYGAARRWADALGAAEAGFALALASGSTIQSAVFGNWILVALLALGEVDQATARGREIGARILPGAAGVVIPFIGSLARCELMRGDLENTRGELGRMFEMCRTVEWRYFDFFAGVYVRFALAEGRLEAAARLLGFATAATEWAGPMSRQGCARDEMREALVAQVKPALLARLIAEGKRLDPEGACALVLGISPK